jgi:TonB family protein
MIKIIIISLNRMFAASVLLLMFNYCYGKTNNRKDLDLRGNVYAVVVKDVQFSIKFGEVVPNGISKDTKIYFLKNGNVYKEVLAPESYRRYYYDSHNNVTEEMLVNIGAGKEYSIGNNVYHLNDTTGHERFEYVYDERNRLKEIKCFRKKASEMEQYLRIVYTYTQTGKKIVHRDEHNIIKEVVYNSNICQTKVFKSRADRPDMTITETLNANGKPIKREVVVGNNFGIVTWNSSYNEHGDEVKIIHQAKVQGQQYNSVETIQYEYDNNGNWIRRMHYVGENLKSWTEREISYAVSDSDYSKIIEETAKMEEKSRAESDIIFNYNKHRQDSIQAEQKALEEEEAAKGPIANVVEVLPYFPGGPEELIRWLSSNMQYPAEAEENGEQGRVVVSFVVDCDGSTSCVQIVKGVSNSLNKEVIRLVRNMPKWIPGRTNGEAVRCRITLPITFRMQ